MLGEYDDDGRLVAGPQPLPPAPSFHYQLECCAPWHVGSRVMEAGSPGAPVSHGLCARCFEKETGEAL